MVRMTAEACDEVSVIDALERVERGALLLDVREAGEQAGGMARDAVALPLGEVESRIAAVEPDRSREILAICASGKRSQRAVDILKRAGYSRAASVAGGFIRWQMQGLPLAGGVAGIESLGTDAAERYSRHLALPEVGAGGQMKLAKARVALIGAGGLGSPAALYLAAAGIGTITLIDDDVVEKSNLQRQVVHTDARVGTAKTDSAAATLAALNPLVHVRAQRSRLLAENVEELIGGHDVVIDGADNFPTRYLLSAASRQLQIPLIYGAVHRFTGQVSVFDPRRSDSPCYRCLFPEPPAAEDAPNCAEAGVLGVLPGIIGLLQASEALKLMLGIGTPLIGRLLCFDALAATFRELRLPRDPQCPGCGAAASFDGYEDIARMCAIA